MRQGKHRQKLLVILAFGCSFFISATNICAGEINTLGSRPQTPLYEGGSPIPVFIVVPEAKLLEFPSTRDPKPVRTAKFGDVYYLCRKSSRGGRTFYLVGQLTLDLTKVDHLSGWISDESCVVGYEALKTDKSIYRKAVITNRWKKRSDDKKRLDVATAHMGPSDKSKNVAELGLFQFFYIWKKIANDASEYWLLGTRPVISSAERPLDAILGWVSISWLLEWNTRQAIQFNKHNTDRRKEPVKIFFSKPEVKDWVRGIRTQTEPLAVETLPGKKWLPSWPRFPLLATESDSTGKTVLMEVAYIGDQIAVDSGTVIGSARKTAQNSQKLEKLKQMVRRIDILLVIDATGSMFHYFTPIARSIDSTFEAIDRGYGQKNIEKPDVRFSVVFFRDYHDPITLVKQKQLTDDFHDVVDYIRNEPVRPGQGANPNDPYELTEAVFYAICYGLENTRFREGSFRQVIVVGDRGNHLPSVDQRGYKETQVADALVAAEASLIALHTASRQQLKLKKYGRAVDEAAMMFKEQFERIAQLISEKGNTILECTYLHQPGHTEVADAILSQCKKVATVSEKIKTGLKQLQRGDSIQLVEEKHGVKITNRLRHMMEKVGLTPEDFRQSSAQICDTGWLAEGNPRSGLQQVEVMLLAEKEEIINLLAVLSRLSKPRGSGSKIRDIWKKALEQELGEDCDYFISIDQYIESALGLPVHKKILSHSLNDIAKMNSRQIEDLRQKLIEEKERLNDILMGSRRNVWFLHEGINYAWLNREDLP